jgi:hypothetical protein
LARLVREGTPVLKVVHEESESNAHTPAAVAGSLLDEIVRDGARQMLAAALRAEVAAYVEAHADQVDEDGPCCGREPRAAPASGPRSR